MILYIKYRFLGWQCKRQL